MGKLFKHQYQYSACITDEVNCHNEKAYIAFYLETSNKTVEEDTLKTKISNVKTQTCLLYTSDAADE